MKGRMLFITAAIFLSSNIVAAQNSVAIEFIKRIENSRVPMSSDNNRKSTNTKNKSGIEKLLLGDYNGDIEYFIEPSFSEPSGIRLIADTVEGRYFIELKKIENKKNVDDSLSVVFPFKDSDVSALINLTKGEHDEVLRHNRDVHVKRYAEALEYYRVKTTIIPVSEYFAKLLYNNTTDMIMAFKGVGQQMMSFDGETVTFRSVIADELWTLTAHSPDDGRIGEFNILFKQLIKEIENGAFDEAKYIELLNNPSVEKGVRQAKRHLSGGLGQYACQKMCEKINLRRDLRFCICFHTFNGYNRTT